MAELTEASKNYIKTLKQNGPTDPNDIFRLLNDLKQKIEASRIALKRSKTPPNKRK